MRLKKVILHKFKIFEDYEVTFDEMNFIKGKNGQGRPHLVVKRSNLRYGVILQKKRLQTCLVMAQKLPIGYMLR